MRCGKKKQINQENLDDKHVSKVFASLMMKGKVRSAMRWLSERASGGVLDPMQEVKKSVTDLETLKSKHPEPNKSHLSSRLQVPVLPDFEDVIISSASIEKRHVPCRVVRLLMEQILSIGRRFYYVIGLTVHT